MNAASWGLAGLLIVTTIAIHTMGVVMMAFAVTRIRARVEARQLSSHRMIVLVTRNIGAVALVLVALHGLEATLWAAGYVWLGAIGPFRDALLYSNGAMTTLSAGGVNVAPQFLLLGTVEAVNAMLLFGISTAFIFTEMQAYWPLLSRRGAHAQT